MGSPARALLPVGAFAILALCFGSSAPAAAPADADFHTPRSGPERALDRILKRAGSDNDILDNLLRGRGTKSYKPSVDYKPLLTSALIQAIRREERAMVRTACKGSYLKGEICRLDYSPITCAQDSVETYEYRTLYQQQGSARIEYRWPGDKTAATYAMVKRAGWQIDGVSCAAGSAFNMH